VLVAYLTEAAPEVSPVRVTKISALPASSLTEAAAASNCTVLAGAARLQGLAGVVLECGLGATRAKSATLLSVSAQPLLFLVAAVVAVGAATTTGPSAQVVVP
jgi:hypothetical protein